MQIKWEETEEVPPYSRLQYIRSTGQHHINTGIQSKQNVSWEITVDMKDGTNGEGMDRSAESFGVSADGNHYSILCGNIYSFLDTGIKINTGKHTFYMSDGLQKIDGKTFRTDRHTATGKNLYLFAEWQNWSGNAVRAYTNEKLFGCKIWVGDELKKDYVPMRRNSDGAIGLMEMVENKFIMNEHSSKTPFLPGPEIIDYLYRNDDDDGSLSRDEWGYDIPSPLMSEDSYNDEVKEWFYSRNNGKLIVDQEKTINNKTYLFDKNGIMQTSLIIKYAPTGYKIDAYNTNYYIYRVDLDTTSGADFIKEGKFYIKDKPVPYEDEVSVVAGHEDDPLYRENCFKIKYNGNHIPYNILYFGDDGAKVTGDKINIRFNDGEYLFGSDKNGAYYGFKNDKYYSNGFICKASDDIGYGILIDYSAFDISALGNQNVATKFRNLSPAFYNYNNYICEKTGIDQETKGEAIASSHTDLTKYHVHYPIASILAKGYSDVLSATNLNYNKKNCVFVVDKSGKKKKKGKYKDLNDNYWLVDKNGELVGIFECEVKWDKIDGKDTPMYKSTFIEIKANGEEEEKDKYMPFFTKDINGKTELDYVVSIDDDYIVDAVVGDYNMGMN